MHILPIFAISLLVATLGGCWREPGSCYTQKLAPNSNSYVMNRLRTLQKQRRTSERPPMESTIVFTTKTKLETEKCGHDVTRQADVRQLFPSPGSYKRLSRQQMTSPFTKQGRRNTESVSRDVTGPWECKPSLFTSCADFSLGWSHGRAWLCTGNCECGVTVAVLRGS